MELNGKTALVTGGAVRIGAAIVRALARAGADVVIHGHRSVEPARALRREVEALGRRAFCVRGDLRREAEVRRVVRESREKGGRLDILVNNAAVFHKDTLRSLTARKLREEFDVNLFAPLLLMRAFAEESGRGSIVNLLDRRITSLDRECLPYVLAKKALAEATRIAALDLAPKIRVNAVAPGAILPPPGEGMAYLKDKAGPIPLRRRCAPEDVAEAVLLLLKNDSLTGQIIFVDGGQHLL
ncbi:MAG TPA: SDR family oxidoreductase [Kiritimatiellia bacterium]|nr:SDR family oxidoreductase [Kiritimatiellia bacterium]HRZ12191.1 SDR family oxidoreductase [Kiritimatiellia bacterium]HSA18051.1 SDR family oxidoreductase [Kiritimatiellia bacterium]